MLTRTGEPVRRSGAYVSQCCGDRAWLLEDQEFTVCGICGRATDWAGPDRDPAPSGPGSPADPGRERRPPAR